MITQNSVGFLSSFSLRFPARSSKTEVSVVSDKIFFGAVIVQGREFVNDFSAQHVQPKAWREFRLGADAIAFSLFHFRSSQTKWRGSRNGSRCLADDSRQPAPSGGTQFDRHNHL